MAVTCHLLHGFLGSPADWDFARERLESLGAAVVTPALFDDPGLSVDDSPAAWAERFNRSVRASGGTGRRVLVGYSLGGRLALHALASEPSLWDAALVVSCHPGLEMRRDRIERRARDGRWAVRFLEEPWEVVLAKWNARAVFGGSAAPARRVEEGFRRGRLAAALWAWSLGHQENLLPALALAGVPLVWVSGARDVAYDTIAHAAVARIPRATHVSVPDAGHRVPWERPRGFLDVLSHLARSHADAKRNVG